MTGLTIGQLTELTARVRPLVGDFTSAGRPHALGLFKSMAMVVSLLRQNITQDFAGAIFGVSQPTVSRRWDVLRPAIGQALAEFVPAPAEVAGAGTVLVDGTIAPTWDWKAIPDLYSGKAGYLGMNLQVGATLGGRLAGVGTTPVHGARHDAHAYTASGLAEALTGVHTAADLGFGYTGVAGIDLIPIRKPAGAELHESQSAFNNELSSVCAAVEHAIAHLKRWRMLSAEGGCYRAPLSKYPGMLKAVTGLLFFSTL